MGSSLDKQKDVSGPTYVNERLYATSLDVTVSTTGQFIST